MSQYRFAAASPSSASTAISLRQHPAIARRPQRVEASELNEREPRARLATQHERNRNDARETRQRPRSATTRRSVAASGSSDPTQNATHTVCTNTAGRLTMRGAALLACPLSASANPIPIAPRAKPRARPVHCGEREQRGEQRETSRDRRKAIGGFEPRLPDRPWHDLTIARSSASSPCRPTDNGTADNPTTIARRAWLSRCRPNACSARIAPHTPVIPAQAGIQSFLRWVPAFAGTSGGSSACLRDPGAEESAADADEQPKIDRDLRRP